MKQINIHIERLVLHDFNNTDVKGVEAAIETALRRVFDQQDQSVLFTHSTDIPFADAGSVEFGTAPRITDIANLVAGSIYASAGIDHVESLRSGNAVLPLGSTNQPAQ